VQMLGPELARTVTQILDAAQIVSTSKRVRNSRGGDCGTDRSGIGEHILYVLR
jgi:hypothetical protein